MRKRDSKIAYQFENECDNKVMVLNTIVRVSLSWRHDGQAKFMPILSPRLPGTFGGTGGWGIFERGYL